MGRSDQDVFLADDIGGAVAVAPARRGEIQLADLVPGRELPHLGVDVAGVAGEYAGSSQGYELLVIQGVDADLAILDHPIHRLELCPGTGERGFRPHVGAGTRCAACRGAGRGFIAGSVAAGRLHGAAGLILDPAQRRHQLALLGLLERVGPLVRRHFDVFHVGLSLCDCSQRSEEEGKSQRSQPVTAMRRLAQT